MDLEGGRRAGTYAEMCDYIKVVQGLDILHQEGGGPFEPLDLPADTRHLDLYFAEITLLDKNWRRKASDGRSTRSKWRDLSADRARA
jgi:trimethylamine--corrinoid protein Co-methyltransferase